MSSQSILIVDDDGAQLGRYVDLARGIGLTVHIARTVSEAKAALEAASSLTYLLTDIHLRERGENKFEGLEILKIVKSDFPEVMPIIMSNDPNIDTYERAVKLGALHYLRKPILGVDELRIAFQAAKSRLLVERASRSFLNANVHMQQLNEKCPDGIVLSTENRNKARKIANHKKIPCVISGETGTGKEEVAKLVHRIRCESEGIVPFVAVNCALLNQEMAASQLFGHKKGAFTGAIEATTGFIGEANGGILFLDEIHTLSMACQQSLLRVLNDGSYIRVGDTKTLHSDFQVIAASTKNLDEEAEAGRFLIDLRMRLSGIDMELKPLRERHDDFVLLISIFCAREGIALPQIEIERIAEKCKLYSWRGNVRDLFAELRAMVVMSDGPDDLIAENFPAKDSKLSRGKAQTAATLNVVRAGPEQDVLSLLHSTEPLENRVSAFERILIKDAYTRHEKVNDVINSLSLSRSGFNGKRRKHGL